MQNSRLLSFETSESTGATPHRTANSTIAADTSTGWLTAAEAAQYLKIKTRTLLRWVRHGKVQAYALSGTKRRVWRFQREDLDRALLAHPVLPSKSPTVLAHGGMQ